MRESYIERDLLKQKVEAYGGLCLKFNSTTSGWPDRIVIHPNLEGKIIFVETKTPRGKLSKIQKVRHKQLEDMGMDVRVFYEPWDVHCFIKELMHEF